MKDRGPDRLISASEVERWSYCPLSWYLDRYGTVGTSQDLYRGAELHERFSDTAGDVITAQKKESEARRSIIAFLIFSGVLLVMGVALVVVIGIGLLTTDLWSIILVGVSIVLVIGAITIHFWRRLSRKEYKRLRYRSRRIGDADSDYGPFIFYLLGAVMLTNGLVILRPLGLPVRALMDILSLSLFIIYFLLLFMVILYIIRPERLGSRGSTSLISSMIVVLIISIAALLHYLSDTIDPEGYLGFVLLVVSLLWFMGAVAYDLVAGKVTRSIRGVLRTEPSDLPIVSLALLGVVVSSSTFLVNERNLEDYFYLSIVFSLVWLLGALIFILRANRWRKEASRGKRVLSLPSGSDIRSRDVKDRKGDTGPMRSRRHYLVGTPDLMIEEDQLLIPVEYKSGAPPPKPHFSHTMQLGAYLILTDEVHGQTTPYGYIEYGGGAKKKRFKVEWDMMTKAMVLAKVSEIRNAEIKGEAHRNHSRPGKCRHCSRRSICPERLV